MSRVLATHAHHRFLFTLILICARSVTVDAASLTIGLYHPARPSRHNFESSQPFNAHAIKRSNCRDASAEILRLSSVPCMTPALACPSDGHVFNGRIACQIESMSALRSVLTSPLDLAVVIVGITKGRQSTAQKLASRVLEVAPPVLVNIWLLLGIPEDSKHDSDHALHCVLSAIEDRGASRPDSRPIILVFNNNNINVVPR